MITKIPAPAIMQSRISIRCNANAIESHLKRIIQYSKIDALTYRLESLSLYPGGSWQATLSTTEGQIICVQYTYETDTFIIDTGE